MTKYNRILSKLYLVFGALTLLCFGTYFIKLFVKSEGVLPWIATSLVIITVFLPAALKKLFPKLSRKFLSVLKSIICIGMIFFVVTFVMLVFYIFSDSGSYEPGTEDNSVFIVFGSKINRNGPTQVLAARLDKVKEAMDAEPESVCILSGGQGIDENMPESECMKKYLLEKGIPENRIICESESSDTIQNIRNSMKILEERDPKAENIVCVSSDTHIPRIKLICEKEGLDTSFLKSPSPVKISTFTSLVREYLSYVKMILVYR